MPVHVAVGRKSDFQTGSGGTARPQRLRIAVDKTRDIWGESAGLNRAELPPRSILVPHLVQQTCKLQSNRRSTWPLVKNLAQNDGGLCQAAAFDLELCKTKPRLISNVAVRILQQRFKHSLSLVISSGSRKSVGKL